MIRLDGMGEPQYPGGPAGAVIITLAVAPVRRENTPQFPDAGNSNRPTALSGNQNGQRVALNNAVSDPQIGFAANATPHPFPLPTPTPVPSPTPPRSNRRIAIIALVIVAVLVILSSGTIFAINTINTNNAHATSTATSNNATARVNASSTARASGTAIAIAHATATAAAKARATATFIAQNSDPYPPTTGTIALVDPLNGSSTANWGPFSDAKNGGACQYTNGAYHVSENQTNRFEYCYKGVSFGNFAFEAQMRIIQGDCGGFTFRININANQLYRLEICQNGNYDLYAFNNGTNNALISPQSSALIHQGLNATNTVAIVANGNSISIFVNHNQISNINDSRFSTGFIGMMASEYTNATDVAYTNARLWML